MQKDTEELKNELNEAADVEWYLASNQDNLRSFTLA